MRFPFFQKNKQALLFLQEALLPYRRVLFLFLFVEIISGVFSALLPLLAKWEIDQLSRKNIFSFLENSGQRYEVFLGIIFLVFLLQGVDYVFTQIFSLVLSNKTLEEAEISVDEKMFQKMGNIRLGYYLNTRIQKILSEIQRVPQEIMNIGKKVFSRLVEAASFFVVSGIILFAFHPGFLLLIFVGSLLVYVFEKAVRNLQRLAVLLVSRRSETIRSHALGMQLRYHLDRLVTSGWLKSAISALSGEARSLMSVKKNEQMMRAKYDIFAHLVSDIMELWLKAAIGYAIYQGTQSLGMMAFMLGVMMRFSRHIRDMFSFFIDFSELRVQIGKLRIILSILHEINPEQNVSQPVSGKKIQFENVSFSYPKPSEVEWEYCNLELSEIQSILGSGKMHGRNLTPMNREYYQDQLVYFENLKKEMEMENPEVLHGCSLSFEVGKVYGLVGKNGSGKTTLLYLLQNYFESFQGNILLDGHRLVQISPQWFHNHIGVIHQDPYIISDISIRENVVLGVQRSVTDEEIWRHFSVFWLDAVLRKLPSGLGTVIGSNTNLSGGQKQILAFVRVLLQDRPILVLDEGTNQLDADNELLAMQQLLARKKDKIIIFVTHRMTTMRSTDLIYCLENGHIVNSGTHQELMGMDSPYARFWRKQVELQE